MWPSDKGNGDGGGPCGGWLGSHGQVQQMKGKTLRFVLRGCSSLALRLPHTRPGMRVAGLRGGVILVLSVDLMVRLAVLKVAYLLAG